MRRSIVIAALVATAVTCGAAPVTVQIEPAADAVVASLFPDDNYGAGGAVAAGGPAAPNGYGDPGILDSFMRFDTAGLVTQMDALYGAANWHIESATLRLNEQARPNNSLYNRGQGDFEIRWIADDGWEEGTGKPRNPTADGVTFSTESLYLDPLTDVSLGTFANYGPGHPDDFIDLFCDLGLLTAFVDDILAGGDVSLFLTAATDDVGMQAAAGENKDTTARPYLELAIDEGREVDLIPEPAALSLVAFGVLACLRRRRR